MKGGIILDITFLPRKRVPKNIKPVTYHVNEENNVIAAIRRAKQVFMIEHPFRYYDKIAITDTRIL